MPRRRSAGTARGDGQAARRRLRASASGAPQLADDLGVMDLRGGGGGGGGEAGRGGGRRRRRKGSKAAASGRLDGGGDGSGVSVTVPPARQPPSQLASAGLRHLVETFAMLDQSVVASVYMACGRDAHAALGPLLAMVPQTDAAPEPPAGGGASPAHASWAGLAAAGTGRGAARRRDPLGELPLDTLVMVVEMLGVYDQSSLARASRHCRDLVREAFSRVTFLAFQSYWEDWRVLEMLRRFPKVESVLLRASHFESFAQLPSSAPRLRKLNAGGCQYLDDDGVQHLAAFLPGLRELSLARTAVTDVALHHLAEHGGLEFLSLENCPHVSGRGVARLLSRTGQRLHGLDLSGTQVAAEALAPLELLQSATQRVMLKKCRRLTSLELSSPGSPLTSLNASGCSQLERVRLSLPSLASLNVSNCKRLRELVLRCPSLGELNLSGCSSLRVLTFEGPAALERVNLFQCKDVQSGDFRAMATAAGPSLRSVNACGLIHLPGTAATFMVEKCENLEELDLAGCRHVDADQQRAVTRALAMRQARHGAAY